MRLANTSMPVRGQMINKSLGFTRGLKLLWLFNEGTGSFINDYSGNGMHGKVTGDYAWINSSPFRSYGPALDLRTGGVIDTPTNVLWMDPGTLDSWMFVFFLANDGRNFNDQFGAVSNVSDPVMDAACWSGIALDSATLRAGHGSGGSTKINVANAMISQEWTHHAVTYQEATVLFYNRNGVRFHERTNAVNSTRNYQGIRIGLTTAEASGNEFDGAIGMLAIWDRPVNNDESLQYYKNMIQGFELPSVIPRQIMSFPPVPAFPAPQGANITAGSTRYNFQTKSANKIS